MSIRTKLLLSAAAAVMASGSAFAADLPSRTEAPPAPYIAPPPIFTWTGFYIGVNAGASFGSGNNNDFVSHGFSSGAPGTRYVSSGNNDTNFTGGGQVGYNWQAGPLVYGLEADFDYLGSQHGSIGVPSGAHTPYFVAVNGNNNNYLGTVRGRLGYAVDRALFYVTGGLAYGGSAGGGSVTYYPSSGGPYAYTSSGNNSNVGYAVGGGVEYAFTPNWTARVEYLYVNRGNKTLTYAAPVGAPSGTYFVSSRKTADNLLRVGVNYKF